MGSTNENLIYWQKKIDERIKSGMLVNDCCEKNNICRSQYYYWYKKIKDQKDGKKGMVFAGITPTLLNDNKAVTLTDLPYSFRVSFKDVEIIVPDSFNLGALLELMKVIKSLL